MKSQYCPLNFFLLFMVFWLFFLFFLFLFSLSLPFFFLFSSFLTRQVQVSTGSISGEQKWARAREMKSPFNISFWKFESSNILGPIFELSIQISHKIQGCYYYFYTIYPYFFQFIFFFTRLINKVNPLQLQDNLPAIFSTWRLCGLAARNPEPKKLVASFRLQP